MENGGIDTEKSYPYMQSVGKCDKKKHNVANMTACRYILSGSERDLEIAVALEGPVSVAIDASQKGFQSCKSGIYDDPNCTPILDHAVLVVGYGTEGGKDYWLVKKVGEQIGATKDLSRCQETITTSVESQAKQAFRWFNKKGFLF